ncbi:MAG: transporter substrate-binding domain-containing protein [Candidatus Bathyarchaeota archaeon]|nr:transporter substrate-binding domain-containing protein [Candidatus Bathyarchaeota archaeon]
MNRTRKYAYLFFIIATLIALFWASAFILQLGRTPSQTISTSDLASFSYYTEEFPPYNYQENGTLNGIAIDLLREITTKLGKTVEANQLHLTPWTVGYQATLNINNTILFSTARLPEREQSFKWVGPIFTDKYVLFAESGGPTINSSSDLKNYKIGVITDDAAVMQLMEVGVDSSHLTYETNASVLVNKLLNGEIDLWCYPEAVGRQITEQATGNYFLFKVAFPLDNLGFYYAFNKDIPDSTVNSFQRAIGAIKEEKDGSGISGYERILGRYIPSVGLAQLNYLTEDWAPFNYLKDGKPAGVSVEILQTIFRYMGVNRTTSDIQFVPLADGFKQAQGNTSTVLFSIVRTSERETFYKWAGPFTKSTFVVFALVTSNITIDSPQDLNRYKIGTVKSSIENELLINQGVNSSHIVNELTPQELLQRLKEGEIELWATGDSTGRYEMQKAGLDPNAYQSVYTLGENDFYFVFSRDVPDNMVNAFQHAIQMVRNQKDAQGVSEYEKIVYRNLGVGFAKQLYTDKEVIALVDKTAAAIAKNAPDTFRRINAGEAPYKDSQNTGLYVFVYDTNVTMVAHADNTQLVGVNFKGKTDVTGEPFRDKIVAGALENQTGWVEYVYMNPSQTNLYYKTTYYRLIQGSDGKYYVVCSGNFKEHP